VRAATQSVPTAPGIERTGPACAVSARNETPNRTVTQAKAGAVRSGERSQQADRSQRPVLSRLQAEPGRPQAEPQPRIRRDRSRPDVVPAGRRSASRRAMAASRKTRPVKSSGAGASRTPLGAGFHALRGRDTNPGGHDESPAWRGNQSATRYFRLPVGAPDRRAEACPLRTTRDRGRLREARCSSPSNSQVSGPSSEEPETAPFVKEQQSHAALLRVVDSGRVAMCGAHASFRARAITSRPRLPRSGGVAS
jgi:hypothetical protein